VAPGPFSRTSKIGCTSEGKKCDFCYKPIDHHSYNLETQNGSLVIVGPSIENHLGSCNKLFRGIRGGILNV
jgi:hypothetical protein